MTTNGRNFEIFFILIQLNKLKYNIVFNIYNIVSLLQLLHLEHTLGKT